MKRSLPLVVIFLMLGTLKGQSSSSDPIQVIGIKEALSKSERVDLAEELLQTFANIEAAVPTLSPSQKEWLVEESNAMDDADSRLGARFINFHQSQEFTIEYTKTRLSSLVGFLQLLTGPKVATGEIGAQEQVFYWSEVAYLLIEQQFYDFLIRLGKLGFFDDLAGYKIGLSIFDDAVLSSAIYRMKAEDILGSIVMPYLLDQFPE